MSTKRKLTSINKKRGVRVGHVKPKNWRAKRKTRQLMSKASRRRNRGQR